MSIKGILPHKTTDELFADLRKCNYCDELLSCPIAEFKSVIIIEELVGRQFSFHDILVNIGFTKEQIDQYEAIRDKSKYVNIPIN